MLSLIYIANCRRRRQLLFLIVYLMQESTKTRKPHANISRTAVDRYLRVVMVHRRRQIDILNRVHLANRTIIAIEAKRHCAALTIYLISVCTSKDVACPIG